MVPQDGQTFFILFVFLILVSHVKCNSYSIITTSNHVLRTLYQTNGPDMSNGIYSNEISIKNLCLALRYTLSSDRSLIFKDTQDIEWKIESTFANANIKLQNPNSPDQTLLTKNCQLNWIESRESIIFLAAPPKTFIAGIYTSTGSVVVLTSNGPDKVGYILGVICIGENFSRSFPKQPTQTNEGTSAAVTQTYPPVTYKQIPLSQGIPLDNRPIYQQPRPYSQPGLSSSGAQTYPQSVAQRGQSSTANYAPATRNPTEFIDFMGPSLSDLQDGQQRRARTSPDNNVTDYRYPIKTYDFMGPAPSQPNLQGEQPKRARYSQQQEDATPSTQNDSPPKTLDLTKWGK